jgi:peptidoglycan hydrolase FlgJ
LAISAPGDIVMDVMRAADPATAQAAKARLGAMRASAAATTCDAGPVPSADATRAAKPPETRVKFEAMVLQTFLQSMLPKEAESHFGSGMAGEMWQSMLAEQLAGVMAARGGIGIAERVLGDHYMEGEKMVPLQGVSRDPDRDGIAARSLLSQGLVQEIERRAAAEIAPTKQNRT